MNIDLHEALAMAMRPQDEADGRIFGFVPGVVTDVNDPASLGRIKARLSGQQKSDATGWLDPMWPGAIEGKTRVGDSIYACFVHGDPNRGLYCCAPRTTARNRPTEAVILGNAMLSLFNKFVDIFNAHTHDVGGVSAGAATVVTLDPNDVAFKAKAADGSVVASASASLIALSGEAKVR